MTRKIDESHISDLQYDPRNARKRTIRSSAMIQSSLQEVGASRSIVIDEHNRILAGNGTIEAAGQIGIEKMIIVDADGETIVAVRRSGLTEQQKIKLALFDNRTSDLSEWDADILAELGQEIDLSGLFSTDELARLIENLESQKPSSDEWGDALGSLPDGDKAPFQQMTFTLHDDQALEVKEALEVAKKIGLFTDSPNENSNGNALARVCEIFLTQHGQS